MNDLSMDTLDELNDDVIQFECWYHSVMDDVASLIRANGYDKVMFDVMCAVERMSKDIKESDQ